MGLEEVRFTALTELVNHIPANLEKSIVLITDVSRDGIGDLIHQHRAFKILNRSFPGKIRSMTFCYPDQQTSVCEKMAEEIGFSTECFPTYLRLPLIKLLKSNNHELPSESDALAYFIKNMGLTQEKAARMVKAQTSVELIVVVSHLIPITPGPLHPSIRQFDLIEINHKPLTAHERLSKTNMGLYPSREGIWCDAASQTEMDDGHHLLASKKLQTLFNCPVFDNEADAKAWFDTCWISQAHCYERDYFIMGMVAQAAYVHKKHSHIDKIIIKFNSIDRSPDRSGREWSEFLPELQNTHLRSALNSLNIKSIEIPHYNRHTIDINPKNKIVIRLVSTKIPYQYYPLFRQMVTGIDMPGGDNTYSEAFSNPHTKLPALFEFRKEKIEMFSALLETIERLWINVEEKQWLRKIYSISEQMHQLAGIPLSLADENIKSFSRHIPTCEEKARAQAIDLSLKLAECWASCDNAQSIWQKLCAEIKKHALDGRLVSIIKEQLCFARDPQLMALKEKLCNSDLSVHQLENHYTLALRQSASEHQLTKAAHADKQIVTQSHPVI